MSERIVIDPHVCHGKPIIQGTRTPVAVVLGALAAGDTFEQIREDYAITDVDIRACLAFACDELNQQTYHPVPA